MRPTGVLREIFVNVAMANVSVGLWLGGAVMVEHMGGDCGRRCCERDAGFEDLELHGWGKEGEEDTKVQPEAVTHGFLGMGEGVVALTTCPLASPLSGPVLKFPLSRQS